MVVREIVVGDWGVVEFAESLFDRDGVTLTRFFTTQDADEMTRDPIFSFNPDLPMVSNDRTAELEVWSDADCEPWGIMKYPDGSTHTFDCNETDCFFGGFIGPVPDAPALKYAEILEETGLPRVFDTAQAPQVDEVLDQTTAGGDTFLSGTSDYSWKQTGRGRRLSEGACSTAPGGYISFPSSTVSDGLLCS